MFKRRTTMTEPSLHLLIAAILYSNFFDFCDGNFTYTDSDCTKEGGQWIANSCYKQFTDQNTHYDAQTKCKQWAGPQAVGHLAHILNSSISSAINSIPADGSLGGFELYAGNWFWTYDTGPLTAKQAIAYWANNLTTANNAYQCLKINSSPAWQEQPCNDKTLANGYLCQKYADPNATALCPPGWQLQGDNCYLYAGYKMTWVDANDYCHSRYAHLPTIKSDNDWVELSAYRSSISNYNNGDDNIWLSLNWFSGVAFQWHDKTNLTVDHYWYNSSNENATEPSPYGCRYCCPWRFCDMLGGCVASLGSYADYKRAWATATCDGTVFQTVCVRASFVSSAKCDTFNVENGNLTYSVGSNPLTATLDCTNIPVPPITITCQSGIWSNTSRCDGNCAEIPLLNALSVSYNGSTTLSPIPPLIIATITCNATYVPYRAITTAQCLSGVWQPSTPLCVTACSSTNFTPDANGDLSFSDPTFYGLNSQVTKTCRNGYAMNGTGNQPQFTSTVFCSPDGWLDDFPICISMCDFKPCLNNGTCSTNGSAGFNCACQEHFNGTYCQKYYGPCSLLPPGKRKKRFLEDNHVVLESDRGQLDSKSETNFSRQKRNFNFFNFNLPLVTVVTKGILGPLLATVTNLVKGLLTLVGTVVKEVVKDVVVPLVTPLINETENLCYTVSYEFCLYGDCVGGVRLLDSAGKTCFPYQAPEENCTIEMPEKPDGHLPPTTTKRPKVDPLSPDVRVAVTVVQTSSCVVLIGFLATTLILFCILRVFSLERIPQMCQEVSLLIAHILIATLKDATEETTVCIAVSVALQYFTLSNFVFIILECLNVFCVLQNVISFGGFFNRKQILLLGWGIPALITGLTAGFQYADYPSTFSCWLNLDDTSHAKNGTVYPIVFATGIAMILAEAATLSHLKPLPFTPRPKVHAALVSQKGLFFILPLNIMAWVAGMYAAYNPQFIWLYGAVSVLNILLGLFIFVFHISGNDRVQEYCKRVFGKLCLCLVTSKVSKLH